MSSTSTNNFYVEIARLNLTEEERNKLIVHLTKNVPVKIEVEAALAAYETDDAKTKFLKSFVKSLMKSGMFSPRDSIDNFDGRFFVLVCAMSYNLITFFPSSLLLPLFILFPTLHCWCLSFRFMSSNTAQKTRSTRYHR